MTPVLEWTDTGRWHEANIGEMLCLAVSPCEVRQEWDWRVDTYDGRLIGEGTDDGRGIDAAKLAAEAFARTWIAEQSAALGDGWISVEERLPEAVFACHVACRDERTFHGCGYYLSSGRWAIDGDLTGQIAVTHWRPLPPLPEVK